MPSDDLMVRNATAADAAAIATIYNQGIIDRIATLETEERTPEERARWLAARGPRHPVLMAERDGVVVGWGSLNPFNPRKAYGFRTVGIYKEQGLLDGQWVDTIIMEKIL